jgi:hypothetical protein
VNARRIVLFAFAGGLLALGVLIGGGIGGEETAEPPAMRLGEPGMPLAEHDAPTKELPEGFVPDLPAVPTLPAGTHVPHAHGAGAGEDERGDDLSAEMRLLSEARDELAEEDAASCLTLLDQHRERFPTGALSEDRDAYTILALHALGREPEVERRYVDFRQDYPSSTFLDTLARELSHP